MGFILGLDLGLPCSKAKPSLVFLKDCQQGASNDLPFLIGEKHLNDVQFQILTLDQYDKKYIY